jgi:hypothetical protein
MQEHAIDFVTYSTQHFDAFRNGGSVLNQIPTSRFIQSQDGAHISQVVVYIWKALQCIVLLEKHGYLLVFVVGQVKISMPLKNNCLQRLVLLECGDECNKVLSLD